MISPPRPRPRGPASGPRGRSFSAGPWLDRIGARPDRARAPQGPQRARGPGVAGSRSVMRPQWPHRAAQGPSCASCAARPPAGRRCGWLRRSWVPDRVSSTACQVRPATPGFPGSPSGSFHVKPRSGSSVHTKGWAGGEGANRLRPDCGGSSGRQPWIHRRSCGPVGEAPRGAGETRSPVAPRAQPLPSCLAADARPDPAPQRLHWQRGERRWVVGCRHRTGPE